MRSLLEALGVIELAASPVDPTTAAVAGLTALVVWAGGGISLDLLFF